MHRWLAHCSSEQHRRWEIFNRHRHTHTQQRSLAYRVQSNVFQTSLPVAFNLITAVDDYLFLRRIITTTAIRRRRCGSQNSVSNLQKERNVSSLLVSRKWPIFAIRNLCTILGILKRIDNSEIPQSGKRRFIPSSNTNVSVCHLVCLTGRGDLLFRPSLRNNFNPFFLSYIYWKGSWKWRRQEEEDEEKIRKFCQNVASSSFLV